MQLYLRLLLGLLRRALRSRQQLAVCARRSTRPTAAERGSRLLVRRLSSMAARAYAPAVGAAGDGDSLTPDRVAPVLELEQWRSPAGTTAHRCRAA